MYRIFALLAILAAASFIAAKPAKPQAPKPKAEKKLPDLMKLNPTNWGDIEQVGRNFKITGHPIWEAVGKIDESGTVKILWTLLSTGEPCPGEYEVLPNGTLQGRWNYAQNVYVEDGKLKGLDIGDRIYQVPVVPDI